MSDLEADSDDMIMAHITDSGVDSGKLFHPRGHDIFSPGHLYK
jgi:hypothetical protein